MAPVFGVHRPVILINVIVPWRHDTFLFCQVISFGKKLILMYYHSSLFKKAFKFQKYGSTLILDLRTIHKFNEIEQDLLQGSPGRMKEQLSRVRRQGRLSLSATEWLGDLGESTTSLGVGCFVREDRG